jgi:hypothetical protein
VRRFVDELKRVEFVLPEPFEELEFVPLGIKGYGKQPFAGSYDDLFVVSPFVSAEAIGDLHRAVDKKGALHLVSRSEELSLVSAVTLRQCTTVQAFNDRTYEEEGEASDADAAKPELSGLHAKIFIADEGWNSSVWCGSANATAAAFNINVEFLTRLVGKKSQVGIKAFLAAEKGTNRIQLVPRALSACRALGGRTGCQGSRKARLRCRTRLRIGAMDVGGGFPWPRDMSCGCRYQPYPSCHRVCG